MIASTCGNVRTRFVYLMDLEKGRNVIMDGIGIGIAIGIGAGFGGGFGSGIAAGITSARERLKKRLHTAIDDNEVSIRDKNGGPLTVDELFALLDKNYKKV